MAELQSMKNTNQYTVLNFDQTSEVYRDVFDFTTLKSFYSNWY
jgi:dipeptidyl-peptidase-4